MSYPIEIKALYDWADSSKMSLPERLFNNEGYLLLRDYINSNIEVILYEHISFNIPGGKYTPDFFVIFSNGSVAFVEVKQEASSKSGKKYYAGRSYRDSRSKLRAASEMNPWFKFFQATYNSREGWRIELISPTRGLDNLKLPRQSEGGLERNAGE